MEKRDYQEKDLAKINKAFETKKSVCYQGATGSGKSVVATKYISGVVDNKGKVLVLAHRRRLLEQLEGHMNSKKIEVGMMVAKTEKNLDANVVIASVHTATRENRLETLKAQGFTHIVVDEAHRIASDSYKNIINALGDTYLLGLTATPTRRDKKDLGAIFDELICCEKDIYDLTKEGYLANVRVYATPVVELDEVDKNSNDYKIVALSTYMKSKNRVEYAVTSYKELGEGRQVLIFCVDKSHGKSVLEAYAKGGITNLAYIDADTPEAERNDILAKYESKELLGIISVETLIEGIDLPETGCVQSNRPTKSLTIYMQMLGRGMRKKEDGSDLIFLDCAGMTKEFSFITAKKSWSLNPYHNPNKTEGEEKKIVARRKDGSYTDDLDEAEYLELEEMTQEEYAEKMMNSLEDAEKFNENIEKEVCSKKTELFKSLLTNTKLDKKYELRSDIEDANAKRCYVIRKGGDRWSRSFEFEVTSGKLKVLGQNNNTEYEEYVEDCANLVSLQALTMNKDFLTEFLTEFALLEAKLSKKINVNDIKEKKAELEKTMLEDKINNRLKEGGVFKSSKSTLRLSDLYPHLGWFDGRTYVDSMVMEDNTLKAKNKMKLFSATGTVVYETNSAKREKIMEIVDMMKVEL